MDRLFNQTLAKHGHSLTGARRILFKALWRQEPMTMKELILLVAGKLDRSSVYRNIDLFEKLAIVHRITIGWKYKLELSEAFSYHHHHIICLGCDKIIPIKDSHSLEKLVKDLAYQYDFTITNHQFEVQGYCPGCSDGLQ